MTDADRWRLVDEWLNRREIHQTGLVAFLATLAALVLIAVFGAPLTLAAIFGPLAGGGGGYALWRAIRNGRDARGDS
jgi:hypothetical protein